VRHYCTLFDKNYTVQALAMAESLSRHGPCRLYALCMDEPSYGLLKRLDQSYVEPIHVRAVETPEIRTVRERMTAGQYCWTWQPLLCAHLLDTRALDLVTYLEADSLFFSSPEPLFTELGDRSVSLVPHRYARGHDQTRVSGAYCVQFNAFRTGAAARAVLEYWKEACFQYSKDRTHRLPGQTCLDAVPDRFPGVRVLAHLGAGVAPWNVARFRIAACDGVPTVDEVPVVFYHYHQFAWLPAGGHYYGNYPLPAPAVEAFYRPYARALEAVRETVLAADPTFTHRKIYVPPGPGRRALNAAKALAARVLRPLGLVR
jgi:hypothetical protein